MPFIHTSDPVVAGIRRRAAINDKFDDLLIQSRLEKRSQQPKALEVHQAEIANYIQQRKNEYVLKLFVAKIRFFHDDYQERKQLFEETLQPLMQSNNKQGLMDVLSKGQIKRFIGGISNRYAELLISLRVDVEKMIGLEQSKLVAAHHPG